MTNNLQIFSIEDIIKQSERNINNSFNLDCNVNPIISFSLEELNDTDVVNIDLSQDIERENISNNIVSDKYYSINTNNSTGNKDNNYQNNNSTDNIKLHEDVNMDSELLCIDNFVSNDNTNEDSNNCYNENLEEEDNILTQSSLTESNNTIQNSLETWLNVSQQKICDDTNLHVDYSKSYSEKRNFCCYCKKMQSKISRHLENIHKK
ncbi:glycosyltransferase-like protein gnt13 [Pogonomyrmex barbatus]|uniref:Glycosyltransferase-like protein gnt13 n=1 Tax=Pogonomyrmex barbatus TaxID=144034 RepID=A0A8N1S3S4_9HYME|nr:glycosyltransferase-like protein gnt13 [Pogonomyrmex barbatus]